MTYRDFAVGDRVRSVSGGPEMFIDEVYPPTFHYRYRCVWFDSDGNQKSDLFKEAEIMPADRQSD
jgi:uncharacterized protein YodC (DUF2158 family)